MVPAPQPCGDGRERQMSAREHAGRGGDARPSSAWAVADAVEHCVLVFAFVPALAAVPGWLLREGSLGLGLGVEVGRAVLVRRDLPVRRGEEPVDRGVVRVDHVLGDDGQERRRHQPDRRPVQRRAGQAGDPDHAGRRQHPARDEDDVDRPPGLVAREHAERVEQVDGTAREVAEERRVRIQVERGQQRRAHAADPDQFVGKVLAGVESPSEVPGAQRRRRDHDREQRDRQPCGSRRGRSPPCRRGSGYGLRHDRDRRARGSGRWEVGSGVGGGRLLLVGDAPPG